MTARRTTRLVLRALTALALVVPARAQDAAENPDATPANERAIEQRIDQGLVDSAAGRAPDPPLSISPDGVFVAPDDLAPDDASLAAPTSPLRLRTPLDADIGRRIDRGLTAAGEESAFPPDYAYGAFQRGRFLTAFSLALERARTGDATAQTLLGELLSRGLGVKQDLAAAADWYGLAAERGDAEAQYALGRLYLEGRGAAQDFAKAADLLEQAARKGHAVAAREFAYLLLQGKGRDRNAMLAAAYLRRAAGLGDMDAQYALAGLYVEGVGVVGDATQAARWFGQAARNGHIGAQVEYAILLFNGRGLLRDEAVAARWFREAASADNPLAQVRLARLLAEGRGVEKDPAEAARWYLIAKKHGLQDDVLDDWLARLDEATRNAASEAAERWARFGQRRLRTADASAESGLEVDNEAQ